MFPIVAHRPMQEDLLRIFHYIIMEKLIFIIIIQKLDIKHRVISLLINRGINRGINLNSSLDIMSLGINPFEIDHLLLGRELTADPTAV